MDNKFHEDRLKKLLQEMPKVEDHQDKNELFNKIAPKLNEPAVKPNKRKKLTWIVPSLASAFVLILVVVIVQSSLLNPNYQTSESNDMDTATADKADRIEGSSELPPLNRNQFENESSMDSASKESAEDQGLAQNKMMVMETLNSNVFYEEEYSTMIPVAALTTDVNNIVPITLIDATTQQIDYGLFYNNLSNYIDEEVYGLQPYPFENITFDINQEQGEVTLTIPEDYQFGGGGGAIQGKFEGIISMMFRHYNIDTAIIEYEGTNKQLGMLGAIDRFTLYEINAQIYKVYQNNENQSPLLIASNTSNDLRWALEEMRKSEEGSNVKAAIPADVYPQITSMDPLTVSFIDEQGKLGNNQETLNMIEAILMTAKSYGYSDVTFQMNFEHIGPHDLTKPVTVPDAVNPVRLH